jgi:hypothetical protein
MKAIDLAGQTFGRLTAVVPLAERSRGAIVWFCRCACGNSTKAPQGSLRSGTTRSCGCLMLDDLRARNAERTTHGRTKTAEYAAWRHMKDRCHNPAHPKFHNWGGRGISVCREWRDSFEAFLTHIGPRPSTKHSLDRYPDNDGDYEPGNVRWATASQQNANSRDRGPALSLGQKRRWRQHRAAMMQASMPC